MRDGIYDDAAAVTHMSSDTDNVENLAWLCQETWAKMAEVLIGMGMLWNQLGWWSITPLAIVICKLHSNAPDWGNANQYIHSVLASGQMDRKQSWQIGCRLAESKTETDCVNDLHDRLYQEYQDGTLFKALYWSSTPPKMLTRVMG